MTAKFPGKIVTRDPCYFHGQTQGELDCGCGDPPEYFTCQHPGVRLATLRPVHRRPGNPLVAACTRCDYYFPADLAKETMKS